MVVVVVVMMAVIMMVVVVMMPWWILVNFSLDLHICTVQLHMRIFLWCPLQLISTTP